MSDRTFVDTNILLYAHDRDSGEKREIAGRALRELWIAGTGVLSLQVLQEFYVNVTRKIRSPLSREQARSIVSDYVEWAAETTPAEVAGAFRIEDEARISFWDAMIVSCAAKAGASRILSEDLNAGQRIGGILIENPFAGLR
ncbi:MAG TPA: PIN domain-containing protein [Candidatus Sulfotelmatobacter sp.]|nr:PIN domain-containing protein [Candidatus Sulfotelmatobacter sp.]